MDGLSFESSSSSDSKKYTSSSENSEMNTSDEFAFNI
jgi:hypothetical protein